MSATELLPWLAWGLAVLVLGLVDRLARSRRRRGADQ